MSKIWKTIEQLADEYAAQRELAAGAEQDSGEAHLIEPHKALEASEMTLEEAAWEGQIPACCSLCAGRGEFTDPDGYCYHGYPSVLIALGWI